MESAACDLVLCDVGNWTDISDENRGALFQKLNWLLRTNPRTVCESLPTVVLCDTSDNQAQHLSKKLVAAGCTTKIRYHRYSWQCLICMTATTSLNAPLLRRVSELTCNTITDARKLLTALPITIMSEIEMHRAKEIAEELRHHGATVSVIHHVEIGPS